MTKGTNTNLIVKFAVICIIIILIFAVINIQIELKELKEKKLAITKQINAVEDIIEEVNIRLDSPVTDKYIERVAREQLGCRMEGEIIFYNGLAN